MFWNNKQSSYEIAFLLLFLRGKQESNIIGLSSLYLTLSPGHTSQRNVFFYVFYLKSYFARRKTTKWLLNKRSIVFWCNVMLRYEVHFGIVLIEIYGYKMQVFKTRSYDSKNIWMKIEYSRTKLSLLHC